MSLLRGYDNLLATRPIPTRLATASSLAIIGDALAQRREGNRYNMRRAASFVAVEATYRGLMQQPILQWIVRNFHGQTLRPMLGALPISPLLTEAVERVLFNQFVVSPGVFYPLYFGITGMAQGLSLAMTLRRARAQIATLFGCNLCSRG